jgi:presenilin-like A22 family membrane protease
MRRRVAAGVGFAALLFLLVQLWALALVPTFYESGYQTVEDPSDPTNSLVYIVAILVATAAMLAAFKYDLDWVVRAVVIVASAGLAWQVFDVLVPDVVALALAGAVGVALVWYPEWYVIDTAGVLMGGAAAGLFGISFGLLPSILLLVVLAVYDAISVYGTEHMLELADGVMDMKVPVILVVPTTLGFSFLDLEPAESPIPSDEDDDPDDGAVDADATDDEDDVSEPGSDGGDVGGVQSTTAVHAQEVAANGDGRSGITPGGDEDDAPGNEDEAPGDDPGVIERDALFIGLGDAVMPTILVASAAHFHTAAPGGTVPDLGVPFLTMNLPALGAIVGTHLGLLVLLWMVLKGRAHAGLPLLNGGAIAGYLVCALVVGLSLPAAFGL